MSSSKGKPFINQLASAAAIGGLALLATFPGWGRWYSRSRTANQYGSNPNRPVAQNNLTGTNPNSNPGTGSSSDPTGQSNYNTGYNTNGGTPSPTGQSGYSTAQGNPGDGYGTSGYGSAADPATTQTGTADTVRALW